MAKNNNIVWIGLGTLAVVGGALYLFLRKNKKSYSLTSELTSSLQQSNDIAEQALKSGTPVSSTPTLDSLLKSWGFKVSPVKPFTPIKPITSMSLTELRNLDKPVASNNTGLSFTPVSIGGLAASTKFGSFK